MGENLNAEIILIDHIYACYRKATSIMQRDFAGSDKFWVCGGRGRKGEKERMKRAGVGWVGESNMKIIFINTFSFIINHAYS